MDDDRHLLFLQGADQGQALAVLEHVVEDRDIGPVGRRPGQRIGAAGEGPGNGDANPVETGLDIDADQYFVFTDKADWTRHGRAATGSKDHGFSILYALSQRRWIDTRRVGTKANIRHPCIKPWNAAFPGDLGHARRLSGRCHELYEFVPEPLKLTFVVASDWASGGYTPIACRLVRAQAAER